MRQNSDRKVFFVEYFCEILLNHEGLIRGPCWGQLLDFSVSNDATIHEIVTKRNTHVISKLYTQKLIIPAK